MTTYTASVKGTQKLFGFYGNGNGATYTITATNGSGVMKKFDAIRRPIRGGIPNTVGTSSSGVPLNYTENARFDFELEIWADVTTAGTFTATVTSSAGGDNITMSTVDENNVINDTDGKALSGILLAVPSNRSVTTADFERELSIASGVALTIPADSTLGISDVNYSPVIALYAAGAAAFTLVTTAVTMRGTAPTFAQYGWYGIKRVGADEWAYL